MPQRTKSVVRSSGTVESASFPSASFEGQLVQHADSGTVYKWDGASWAPVDSGKSRGAKPSGVSARDAVTMVGGTYVKTDPSQHDRVDGIVAYVVEGEAEVWSSGVVPGFTGMTSGDRLFVSSSAGVLGGAPSGLVELPVGYAISATELMVRIGEPFGD